MTPGARPFGPRAGTIVEATVLAREGAPKREALEPAAGGRGRGPPSNRPRIGSQKKKKFQSKDICEYGTIKVNYNSE